MTVTRAAVLREIGVPLSIEVLELDEPGPGEVLVRIAAAGVCHSDLHYMMGDLQSKLPVVPGHEAVGIVESAGSGVTTVAVGDRVILTWRPRCGECAPCTSGRPGLCALGAVHAATGGLIGGGTRMRDGRGGTVHHLMGASAFSERVVVSQRSVIRIPVGVSDDIAAIVGCAIITGAGAVLNRMRGATGQGVAVIGAGGVGLSAVMALALIGAHPIIALDPAEDRRRLTLELGATQAIDSTDDRAVAIARGFAPDGIGWALDAVGRPETLERAVELVDVGGTAVAAGLGRVGSVASIPINPLVQQEKSVVGSLYGSANPGVQIPRLLELHRAGRWDLGRLVGPRFPLERVGDAFDAMTSGAPGRAVLVP